jgi:hypothetical protein
LELHFAQTWQKLYPGILLEEHSLLKEIVIHREISIFRHDPEK